MYFSDNYVLAGTAVGKYALFSPVQKNKGPKLLDPYFGFAYKGKSSNFRVLILQNNVQGPKIQK